MVAWVNNRCLQMFLNVCLFNSHCKLSPFIFYNISKEHWCLWWCFNGNQILSPSDTPKYVSFESSVVKFVKHPSVSKLLENTGDP